jgi:transitional endoplasmic reticulum ATPase
MPISTRQHAPAAYFSTARDRSRFALQLAQRVYATIDRRMSEAPALVDWLNESAASLALTEFDLSNEDLFPDRRRILSAQDWRCVGAAIAAASAELPAGASTPADLWSAAIARTLPLDPTEAAILSLALQYQLDPLVENLFDRLSASRGGPPHFCPDPELIGLLLGRAPADVASRLAARASLLASGLLYVKQDGSLHVPSRLVSLCRAGTPPARDFYDQLLGTATGNPPPWEAFAHLGREAEIAARLLQAALANRESGIHILLYGPPGTGKTSFAMALAVHLNVRLRPVTEADDDGQEPDREERLAGLCWAGRISPRGATRCCCSTRRRIFSRRPFPCPKGRAPALACSCTACWRARRCR